MPSSLDLGDYRDSVFFSKTPRHAPSMPFDPLSLKLSMQKVHRKDGLFATWSRSGYVQSSRLDKY